MEPRQAMRIIRKKIVDNLICAAITYFANPFSNGGPYRFLFVPGRSFELLLCGLFLGCSFSLFWRVRRLFCRFFFRLFGRKRSNGHFLRYVSYLSAICDLRFCSIIVLLFLLRLQFFSNRLLFFLRLGSRFGNLTAGNIPLLLLIGSRGLFALLLGCPCSLFAIKNKMCPRYKFESNM